MIRAELYAKEYASWPGWPNDGFAEKPIESIEDTRAIFRELVKERRRRGIDRAPAIHAGLTGAIARSHVSGDRSYTRADMSI